MNYREYRNHACPARESNSHASLAPASSPATVRKQSDPVLGTVAVGTMLLILAWVVTGIHFLAIFALLIVLGYVRIAGALKLSEMSASAEFERPMPDRIPHAFATEARFNGVATTAIADAPHSEVPWKGGGKGLSPWTRRRSAYDGFAN